MPTVEERLAAVEARLDTMTDLRTLIVEMRDDMTRRIVDTRDDLTRRIVETREDMNRRFDQVEGRFDQVDRRFEQVDRQFEPSLAFLLAPTTGRSDSVTLTDTRFVDDPWLNATLRKWDRHFRILMNLEVATLAAALAWLVVVWCQ